MPTRTPGVGHDGGARHAAHLRGLNLERVLNVAMDRPGSFTRAELIEATGLSAPTVGSLTADLIRHGVVKDLGTGPSSGGRRPMFMELNARHRYVAGIDLGPTRTRLAVADLRGTRGAARPAVARVVGAIGVGAAVPFRSGKNFVLNRRRIADAVNHLPMLVARGLLEEIVAALRLDECISVKVGEVH